jgi:flagellar protein FlaG
MSTPVASPAPTPDPTGPAAARTPTADAGTRVGGILPVNEAPDLRLVIEEDKAAGSYVYKTIDIRTGHVVQQVPREEVLRLKDASGYEPGAVVNARG